MNDDLSARINQLPEWARDYIHRMETFVGAPEVQELIQLRDERQQLLRHIAELNAAPRLEDHVQMFHAACGGAVTGPLDNLTCSECGQQMDAFVTDAEAGQLADRAKPAPSGNGGAR